eukprot:363782_1
MADCAVNSQSDRSNSCQAVRRINNTLGHLSEPGNNVGMSESCSTESKLALPTPVSRFTSQVHWNGWGFRDTVMKLNDDRDVQVYGNRYLFSGTILPNFRPWVEEYVGIDTSRESPVQPRSQIVVPDPVISRDFLNGIEGRYA